MTSTATVHEYMTPVPATVDENLSLADAQDRMFANNIRHLPVMSEGALVGIVSQRDLAVAISVADGNARKIAVSAAMHRNPFTCAVGTPLEDVAREMEAHRYGCAVVTQDGRPIGVFTTTDALRALREAVTGEPAERQVRASHVPDLSKERPPLTVNVRAADIVENVVSSPNQGRFG